MFLKAFQSKWFWIFIFSASILGALWGYFSSTERNDKLLNAKVAVCHDFKQSGYPTILAIQNLKYREEYIKSIEDSLKFINYPSYDIP